MFKNENILKRLSMWVALKTKLNQFTGIENIVN